MRRLAVLVLALVGSLSILASPALTGLAAASPVGPSGPAVGLVTAEEPDYVADVQSKLEATGRFSSVTTVDAKDSTPSLATLEQYDALLVWSDYTFNDSTALGNELAQYVDQGGRLVVATFALNNDSNYGLSGAIASYLPFVPGAEDVGQSQLVADDPSSPLLAGVNSFDGGAISLREDVGLAAGAVQVAHWGGNLSPLVATLTNDGHTVVGLNLFPPSSDVRDGFWNSSTDGATLMANALALDYTPRSTPPPTLFSTWTQVAVSPNPATVGDTVTVSATVHPGSAGGTVQFNVNGTDDGNPVPVGGDDTATTSLTGLADGQYIVTATYSGDATYSGSSNNIELTVNSSAGPTPTPTPTPTSTGSKPVVNPTITAATSSAHAKTTLGWYRGPVTITYSCTAGSAPLDASGCPAPVTLTGNGMIRSVTRTVTATDGGSASATTVVNIDHSRPHLRLHGARNHHTYRSTRTITCTASDPLSGIARPCTVTTTRRGHKVRYTGIVTDNAGNRTHKTRRYTISR